ncbi:MarR family transcriptional regulator, partial [Pseudonocardia pini]|uniref:MarR family transcriptional regulator n=1 Tax=Pseudonocardia pini TaxID=2758030 RepID=UPI0015F0247C
MTDDGLRAEAAGAGRTAAHLARAIEVELASVKLSLPQYRLLSTLDELRAEQSHESAASLLADRLAVSRPSVTALVDGLVGRGLVRREFRDEDRRRTWHVLTDEGRRALREADQALDGF